MSKITGIGPSFLPAADLANLADEVKRVEGSVDFIHIDVMDGHFVPNLTFGPPLIASLRRHTQLPFDCHLMMTNPGDYLADFKKAGATGCSVHFEAGNTTALLKEMGDLELQRGLAINPGTAFESYEPYLDQLDMVVIMTVQPGFGGQSFQLELMDKLSKTRDAISQRQLNVAIEVDGGVDHSNAAIAQSHGADTFVAGSAIYGHRDPADAAQRLREILAEAKAG